MSVVKSFELGLENYFSVIRPLTCNFDANLALNYEESVKMSSFDGV